MAQLIQVLSKDDESPLVKKALFTIDSTMNKQPSTFKMFDPNQLKSLVFLQRSQNQQISRLWIFKVSNKDVFLVQLIPQLVEAFGVPLKVGNQRMLIDLLRVVSFQNTLNKFWKIIVQDSNQISLKIMIPAALIVNQFTKILAGLKFEAKSILPRLLTILQPYSLQTMPFYQAETKLGQNTISPLQQVFTAFVLIQTKRQIRLTIEEQDSKAVAKDQKAKKQEILNNWKMWREAALNRVTTCIKVLGNKQCFSWDFSHQKLRRAESNLKIWSESTKTHWKNESKNVFGVKILKEIEDKQKEKSQGSHCQVIMGRFQLVVLASLNAQVNKAFQKILGGQKTKKQMKELELVKKTCKNQHKETSLNSFKNELDFIQYIKDRNCKYISTYYWQMQIKKAEMKFIIMDYYPHTLRSAHDSQNTLLSLQMKLTLLLQIVQALSWLADNQVCHRDIKPQNIMLDANRIPKIVDFGSCCPIFRTGSKHSFQVTDSRLLSTQYYSLCFKNVSENVKKIKYDKNYYQQHILFDAYSFGRVMEQILPEYLTKNLNTGSHLLKYLWQRCLQQVPEDRPTYQQIGYILHRMLQHLERHYQSF